LVVIVCQITFLGSLFSLLVDMISFLGYVDNLRMIPFVTHPPIELSLGRWEKACLKIGNNVVSILCLHYRHVALSFPSGSIEGVLSSSAHLSIIYFVGNLWQVHSFFLISSCRQLLLGSHCFPDNILE
jgi:hypothetical protein